MSAVDCFLVGHNEMDVGRARRMLQRLYGPSSHEYRDRVKYNLSQVVIGGERYSPADLYNEASGATPGLSIIGDSFSLAIACLATGLHRQGLRFDFVNAFADEQEILEERLRRREVGVVAIPTTYYLNPLPVRQIVQTVRRIDPTVPIVVGGPYVHHTLGRSAGPDAVRDLLNATGVDCALQDAYGEDLLPEIVRLLKEKRTPDGVPNLHYRDGDTVRAATYAPRAFDFSRSGVEWGLFAGRLPGVVNVRTAVSCPYRCSFCNFPAMAGRFVLAPIEACEQELRTLHAIGVRRIQFVDDSFNVPQGRFKELLRMMIRNAFEFRWSAYFKCQYADEETVTLMRASGCEFVFCGIESGSQAILDNMNKQCHLETYRACLRMLHDHGIQTMCSLIVGFPGESERTFEETAEFLESERPTFFQQRLWWYDHATPVHRLRDRFGVSGQAYDWQHETMTSDEAHALADRLFLETRGSVHITEYALPFFLRARGMDRDEVESFLLAYMEMNRRAYREPDAEADPVHVSALRVAARRAKTSHPAEA